MTSTHIRIPEEVKQKLDSLSLEGETAGAVIYRLIEFYENKGAVNDELTRTLTDILTRLSALEQDRATDREVISGDGPIPGGVIADDHLDKIKIDEDLRTQIRMRIVGSGYTIPKISETTHLTESTIKKLRSEKNQESVKLTQKSIDALLSLKLPSPEGT